MNRWLQVIALVGLGWVVGILLGLYLGWIAWPTEFTDANPAVLSESYQQDYILMIATVYRADSDLVAARQRLRTLGEDGQDFLYAFVLDQILQGEQGDDVRALAQLAHDLGLESPALQPFLAAPVGEE